MTPQITKSIIEIIMTHFHSWLFYYYKLQNNSKHISISAYWDFFGKYLIANLQNYKLESIYIYIDKMLYTEHEPQWS